MKITFVNSDFVKSEGLWVAGFFPPHLPFIPASLHGMILMGEQVKPLLLS